MTLPLPLQSTDDVEKLELKLKELKSREGIPLSRFILAFLDDYSSQISFFFL
jgi:hypothetical protein